MHLERGTTSKRLRGLAGLAALLPACLGAQLPRASVEITAKTRDSVPVAGVVIEFTPIGGPMRALTTDSAGRVSVAGVEPGSARISARKVGFRPGDLRAVLGGGRNTIPLLLDPVVVPTLNAVRILGGREVLARHAEFEGRRSLGLATASITADDIHKRNPVSTWQMLQALPSIAVNGGIRGAVATSRRSACYLRVIVNGLPLTGPSGGPPNLDDLPPPSDVHGIEVFAGPASIPPQYNSTAGLGPTRLGLGMCGLIAVWTK